MAFSQQQAAELQHGHQKAVAALNELLLLTVRQAHDLDNAQAREYLLHGWGRRVRVLRYSISTIFQRFPPDTARPLASENLDAVQGALHAFVMNLYGAFENLAWAFVHRHALLDAIVDRRKVGLFLASTQRFLPPPVTQHLTSDGMVRWHADYLKPYRDALAHRIALYIPPAIYTADEGRRYNELDAEEYACIQEHRWADLERVRHEKENLGAACLTFLHAHTADSGSRHVYLHPQLVSDTQTLVEVGSLFLAHWHARA